MVALQGGVNVLTALAPHLLAHPRLRELLPRLLRFGTRPLLLIAGIALLLIARALLGGSAAAWLVALSISLTSTVIHVLRLQDPFSTAYSAALTGWLAASADAFRFRTRVRRLMWLFPAGLIGLIVYGWVGWSEVFEGTAGSPAGSRLTAIVSGILLMGRPVAATNRAQAAFLDSLGVGGGVIIVIAVATLVVPAFTAFSTRARDEVERFITLQGRTSMAPLITVSGNRVLELLDGRALIGLKVVGGVAVTVGGPVCEPDLERQAMADFVSQSENRGWIPALMGLDEAGAEQAEHIGLLATKIGEEALIDLGSFSLDGSSRANLRHSVSRSRREGVTVWRYMPDERSEQMDGELSRISESWLAGKHGPELGFTLGRFEPGNLERVRTYVAEREGTPVGFVTWLPYRGGSASVIDLMRRTPDAPPGTMESLITTALSDFARQGLVVASLSGVPLLSTSERSDSVDKLMGWLFEHGGGVYEARGLYEFKKKFDPSWKPFYLGHPGGADLVRIGIALGRAFLPSGLGDTLFGFLRPRPRPQS